MNFADSLKNLNADREKTVAAQQAEDKTAALNAVAAAAEAAVRHDANLAARQGKKRINGYLAESGGGYDDDFYYCLAANHGGYLNFARIDRLTEQMGIDIAGEYAVRDYVIPLNEGEIAAVQRLVEDRLHKLGFAQFTVRREQMKFHKKVMQENFFGKRVWKNIPDGTGTILWIDVRW